MKPIIKCNDNLDELRKLPSGSVDLAYIDPPFMTNKHRGDYDDRWKSIDDYLKFMEPRLMEARRVLKDTGSFYLHADKRAVHDLKLVLDKIFGRDNFRNEIIWHYGGPSQARKNFVEKHDTILLYSKSPRYHFNQLHVHPDAYISRARTDDDGRTWVDQNIGNVSQDKFDALSKSGHVFLTKKGTYRRKQYLDEMKGFAMDDVWNIPIINSQSRERVGYATQKPEKLLERIMLASSNPGDTVLDAFAGSGTTCVVAKKTGRNGICIDSNQKACEIMKRRME